MTNYLTQWMFLAVLVALGATFAVDFVSSSLDGLLTNMENLK